MGHAYTPGLKVTQCARVRKERLLPLPGEVRVQVGQRVTADTVVASASLPGDVTPVNVANKLSISASEVPECMLKREGEAVRQGEPLARTKGFFGLMKSECPSPVPGTVAGISKVTGQVMIQGPAVPVEVRAYVDGEVVEVLPHEGAIIESWATFVQGIFGVGGETQGVLRMVAQSPDAVLDEEQIPADARGKILVGGALATFAALKRARERGAAAVVAGGFHDSDLRQLLGRDLGVAITGNEELGIALVITEGFGAIRMADKTFRLLQAHDGRGASLNGATQIRAGVIRPEIVIPLGGDAPRAGAEAPREERGLQIGSVVRIIREPHFGALGRIVELPAPLQVLESESQARVLVIQLGDGQRAVVPRANVESIQEA